jgi:hypothetical protein
VLFVYNFKSLFMFVFIVSRGDIGSKREEPEYIRLSKWGQAITSQYMGE